MHVNNGAISYMSNIQKKKPESRLQRVALTARLSLSAYDAITEVQRQHRLKTGRALPIWQVIDTAIKSYAKEKGIQLRE